MRTLNLKAKFLIVTIGLVVLLSLVVVILIWSTLTQRILVELRDKAVFMTKHLAAASVDHVLTENALACHVTAHDYQSSDEHIEYVFFLDAQGEVFAHTFEEGFPIDLKKANEVSPSQPYGVQSLVTEKGRILDIAVPLLEGTAGVARVGISEEPIKKGVANIIRLMVGIVVGVILILGGGVALVYSTLIAGPLLELKEVAKSVGQGNLGRRVRVKAKDEIGELGETFNTMIAELQKSRDRIISAKNYTDNILHSMNDALVVVSPEGMIRDANAATYALLGYREAELVDQPAEKIFAQEDLQLKEPKLEDVIKKGLVRNAEKTYVSKDGKRIAVLFSGSVMRDDDGKIQGIVCAARDISQRKRAEEEIQRGYHVQSVLRELLQISLQNISLEEMLEQSLNHIVSIPWLALESRGAIFLAEDKAAVLEMKAQRGLSQPLQTTCRRVPFGRCLCGRAAQSGEIEFADHIDERHQNQYEGISAHGHYCVPVISSDRKVIGVINLYLKEGHRRDEREEEFLRAAANALAGIIERKLAGDKIIETTEQLKDEREAVEKKNIALREILHQIDAEMTSLKQHIGTNIEQSIIPTLLRLKGSSSGSQSGNFEILEKDLRQIVSPFLDTLKNKYAKLSPRELEVCRLIKEGMTSKEIATALTLCPTTVQKYRELIRRKLGLVNEGINLFTYLQSL